MPATPPQVLNDTGIHPLRLLHLLGRLALLMFLPVWLLGDVYTMVHDPLLVSAVWHALPAFSEYCVARITRAAGECCMARMTRADGEYCMARLIRCW